MNERVIINISKLKEELQSDIRYQERRLAQKEIQIKIECLKSLIACIEKASEHHDCEGELLQACEFAEQVVNKMKVLAISLVKK